MLNFLRNLNLERYSFWLGVLTGMLLAWLLSKIQPLVDQLRASMRARAQAAPITKERILEIRLGNDMLHLAQGWHIAAPLFSLDEILIPPRLLAPPAPPPAYEMPITEDITDGVIPYLSDWPELASTYGAPSLSLAEALQRGANLVLIGQPGSGKSIALAHLISQMVRNEAEIGEISHFVPFLVHVADLSLNTSTARKPLEPFTTAVLRCVSAKIARKLPKQIENIFRQKRALILLDGLDELSPSLFDEVADYLQLLLEKYPAIRVVTTATPSYLGKLPNLGFIPIPLASWRREQRAEFIQKWGNLWSKWIAPKIPSGSTSPDPYLVSGWLAPTTSFLNPLELTLRVWAAYAGDAVGPTTWDAIEAHLRRLNPKQSSRSRKAMEQLAQQIILAMQPLIKEAPADMIESGVLRAHADGRAMFLHGEFTGYLASLAGMSPEQLQQLLAQPEWGGKVLTLGHLLAQDNQGSWLLESLREESTDPLLRNLLISTRKMRDADQQSAWVNATFRQLASQLQKQLPFAMKARMLCAMAVSDHPSVPIFFRQLLKTSQADLVQLAILGCGMVRDIKTTEEIRGLISSRSPQLVRAALLALVEMNNKSALEAVAYTLLHGSEMEQRAAAEALANHREEGHPTLEEGSGLENASVRRAVAYGLGRVKQPWARAILERMRVEEDQWVVKDAATQMLDGLTNHFGRIPQPLPPLTETPWLLAFAAERGMGVAPGKPAYEMLNRVLREGNEDQRLAAVYYLSRHPDESTIPTLFQMLFGERGEVREAALNALWVFNACGMKLPSPMQFGLG